jgi:uncharacterized membrane protein (UPF0127 family)
VPNPVPARVRIGAAAVVALAALVGMIALVVHIRADEGGVGRLNFATTTRAAAPFADFGESQVAVGSRCLRVLVASTPAQRGQGLRDVLSLAPYDGMLFVNPSDTNDHYTMANTPTALDITFFSAKGVPVDQARMTPCPHGSDATCPEYASKAPYRFALERPTTSSPASGSLGACAT